MSDGKGCRCAAKSAYECGCDDADWTPKEVIELRQKLSELQAELKEATRVTEMHCADSAKLSRQIEVLRCGFQTYIAKVSFALGKYFSGELISHEEMDEAYKVAEKALSPAPSEKYCNCQDQTSGQDCSKHDGKPEKPEVKL